MASLNPSDIERALVRKLGATVEETRRDRHFEIVSDEGVVLGTTSLSHGWKKNTAIGDKMVGYIARELGLAAPQFVELVRCTIDKQAYLDIVLAAE